MKTVCPIHAILKNKTKTKSNQIISHRNNVQQFTLIVDSYCLNHKRKKIVGFKDKEHANIPFPPKTKRNDLKFHCLTFLINFVIHVNMWNICKVSHGNSLLQSSGFAIY